jgi:hypothetical protein
MIDDALNLPTLSDGTNTGYSAREGSQFLRLRAARADRRSSFGALLPRPLLQREMNYNAVFFNAELCQIPCR